MNPAGSSFILPRLPGELELAADQPAVDAGDKAGWRLAACRGVAAVVEAQVALELHVVTLEVVVDAIQDRSFASGGRVFLAAEVVQRANPRITGHAEAAPLERGKRLEGVRVEGVHGKDAGPRDAGDGRGYAASVEDTGQGATSVG